METPQSGRYSVQSPSKKRVFPGGSSKSKSIKQKEGTGFADSDEDSGDVMIVDEKANLVHKEKEALSSSADKHSYSANAESNVLGQHKSSDSESNYDEFPCHDEYYMATGNDDLTFDKDEALQTYFDSKGIAPGDEASIPWFLVPSHSEKPPSKAASSNSSSSTSQNDPDPLFNPNLTFLNPQLDMNSFSYQYPIRTPLPAPFFYSQFASPAHGSTSNYSYGFPPSYMGSYNGALTYTPFMPPPPMQPPPSSMSTPRATWLNSFYASSQPSSAIDHINKAIGALPLSYGTDLSYQFPQDPAGSETSAIGAGSSVTNVDEKDVIEKFQNFKQFDTVEDFSDHHFHSIGFGGQQPPKIWVKKIQEEWKILEKNLPDTIHVRVCESKMDLLRAVIVGAEGTPYHDGLFFFDLFFPRDYPHIPPMVNYHSGGLGINPNLYSCGKVCLSLLNTWHGDHENQQWIPGVSTILQVLVSIQALILNAKPYFNEPGYERMNGSPFGEMHSQRYNEKVFTLSLRTMVYSIRKPPEHFEDFVIGHFFNRAEHVLGACKAYLEGAQVGSLVNGEAQNIDSSNKSCSQYLKDHLASYIPTLVQTFSRTGAKDLEKFLSPADKGEAQVVPSVPPPFNSH